MEVIQPVVLHFIISGLGNFSFDKSAQSPPPRPLDDIFNIRSGVGHSCHTLQRLSLVSSESHLLPLPLLPPPAAPEWSSVTHCVHTLSPGPHASHTCNVLSPRQPGKSAFMELPPPGNLPWLLTSNPDGEVKRLALIVSCKNTKISTSC